MNRQLILLLTLALALGACAGAPAPQAPEPPELSWDEVDQADGATLYGNLCASCHGADGRGAGPVADVLAVDLPDLTTLSRNNGGKFPLARVEDAIYGPDTIALHGGPNMPVWGPALTGVFDHLPNVDREAFAAYRIRRLARYLESLQVDDGP